MEEEFQAAGICGGNWWMGIHSDLGAYGSYWNMADHMEYFYKEYFHRSKEYFYDNTNLLHNNNIASSASGDHDSMAFQSSKKLQQQADSDSGDSSILMDSTFQMMGLNFSSSSCSSSPDWNQAFICGENYNPNILQEELNLGPNPSSQVQEDWTDPKSSVTCGEEAPSMTIRPFKDVSQDFSLDQHVLINPHNDPKSTCQDISSPSLFLTGSSTYNDYPSTLIQSVFEAYAPPQPQQQSILNNRNMNYFGSDDNWSSEPSTSCWPYIQQDIISSSSVSNNTPLWNASATSSSQPHFVLPTLEEKKPTENKLVRKGVHEASGLVMKKGCEPILKRPRIETPSSLPTFKVRKEKMGDRITALQQLVSPFGKTDTASVLHEAIEYIKYLHDQVNVLGASFLRNDNATHRQQVAERMKDSEGPREDLRSRGLCLMPISSTLSAANESLSAFWTPTFGSNFK